MQFTVFVKMNAYSSALGSRIAFRKGQIRMGPMGPSRDGLALFAFRALARSALLGIFAKGRFLIIALPPKTDEVGI